jgi:hypothetical protein
MARPVRLGGCSGISRAKVRADGVLSARSEWQILRLGQHFLFTFDASTATILYLPVQHDKETDLTMTTKPTLQRKPNPDDLARLTAMQPGEVVILKGVARAAVAYHASKLTGDFRLAQCGDDVRAERLGWHFRSKRGQNLRNLTRTADTRKQNAPKITPETRESFDDRW